jgi:hypothetical protein
MITKVLASSEIQSLIKGNHNDLKLPSILLQFPTSLSSDFEAFMTHNKIEPYVKGGGLDMVQFLRLYHFSLGMLESFDLSLLSSDDGVLDVIEELKQEQDKAWDKIEECKGELGVLQTRFLDAVPDDQE